jgi:putative polyketide hydroxylase
MRASREKQTLSTIDLFGRDFVLLIGTKGGIWRQAVQKLVAKSGLGMSCHHIGVDVEDVDHRWCDKYGVTDSGAVLVRPDGIIGWRAKIAEDAAEDRLNIGLARCVS